MSSLISIRFPDGTVEFRSSEANPAPGESLTAYGREWVVQSVDADTRACVVAPGPDAVAGNGLPAPDPSPA